MPRLRSLVGEAGLSERARWLARWLNPVVASPAAPLETFAALDALGPSLMPRTSRLQGIAMGLSVLGARATAGAGGTALASLPERDGERLWVASARTTGRLLRAGAAGGAVHDLGRALQDRYPAQRT